MSDAAAATTAEGIAAATAAACERHASDPRLEGLEVYRRVSVAVRAAREGDRRGVDVGREDGCAVRVVPRDGATLHAAAATGDETVVGCCIDAALEAGGGHPAGDPWTALRDGTHDDLDADARLPSPGEVESLLDAALFGVGAGTDAPPVAGASLRVARTVECCANHAGLVATRERVRAWLVVDLAPAPGVDTVAPVVMAFRGTAGLGHGVAADRVRARRRPDAPPLRVGPGRRTVVLGPEAAADAVDLVIRAARRPGAPAAPLGPGFVAVDDPGRPGALFGSRLDDAGFDATPLDLTANPLPATGRLRRASFRDLPEPAPFDVTVDPPRVDPPPDRLWVTGVDLRRLDDDELILILRGTVVEAGLPVAPFVDAVLRTTPAELASRCVGGVGRAIESHRGIATPALVFTGLELLSF